MMRAEYWRWSDSRNGNGVDAALLVYGRTKADRDGALAAHGNHLAACGGMMMGEIPTEPVERYGDEEYRREHFGFGTVSLSRSCAAPSAMPSIRCLVTSPSPASSCSATPTIRAGSRRPSSSGLKSDPAHNLPAENAKAKIDPLNVGEIFPDFEEVDRTYTRRTLAATAPSSLSASSRRTWRNSRLP